jgi:hypothetical protein
MIDNSETPKNKNVSELAFEKYLVSHGLNDWDYEPEIPGKSRRPDYRLRYATTDLFLEVKEFRQEPKQQLPQGGAYDPYAAIREKIDAAREKFKHFKEHCCSLVLFNVDAWLVHLDDFWIMAGAMLGDLGFSFPVDMETGSAVGEPTWAFLKRGKMIDYKRLRPQNTTISAVIALTPLALGQKRFEIEIERKEGELGRTLELEEIMRFADSWRARGLNIEETVTRVVVYENPYARIPLRRDIFLGDHDERYGSGKDSIVRVFAGTEVEKLEAAQQRATKSSNPRFNVE